MPLQNYSIEPSDDEEKDALNISPHSLVKSDEPSLGIYCQDSFPPHTPVMQRRAERYYLQSLARELLPTERVAQCLRTIAPGSDAVEIHRNAEEQTAHYRNLLTCGRVWFCPVCSSKITEARAQELQFFCTHWNEQGGAMALITLTLQHDKNDSLQKTLDILKKAKQKFKTGAPWLRIKENSLYAGSVGTTEVTHGRNGWHPHIHELWFFEYHLPLTHAQLENKLKQRWQTIVERLGGKTSHTHGLDFKTADTAIYNYIAKYGHQPTTNSWSIDREVTKAVSKRARSGSRTPWQLLDDYGQGDQEAGNLFQEYAATIKGRNQLNWSRDLKAQFNDLDNQSDDELAAANDPDSALFAELTPKQWYSILNLPRDIRGEILSVTSTGNRSLLIDLLLHYGIEMDIEF